MGSRRPGMRRPRRIKPVRSKRIAARSAKDKSIPRMRAIERSRVCSFRSNFCTRFFYRMNELSEALAARLSDPDPDVTAAYVIVDAEDGEAPGEIRGEARMHVDEATASAEFAIAIDPAFTAQGLGRTDVQRRQNAIASIPAEPNARPVIPPNHILTRDQRILLTIQLYVGH